MPERDERVAVIVPNYNKGKTLRACLEAVYAQNRVPDEVVVVDDASTDGSPDIAGSFPCTLVRLPGNQGPSAARNAGVAATTASLLFFVDSDTAPMPDALANALRVMRAEPDCGMVQGIYAREPLVNDGLPEEYKVAFEHFWHSRTVGRETGTLFLCTLIRREAYEEAGGLDEQLRYAEDTEFGTRLPARYRMVVSDAVVTRHDDDHRFLALLAEHVTRSAAVPSVMLKTHRRQRAGAGGLRVEMMSLTRPRHLDRTAWMSFILMALSLLTLPLAILAPWLLLVLLLLQVAFVVVSHRFLRFAYRTKGAGFALFATGMHIASHAAMTFGTCVGILRAAYTVVRDRRWPAGAGGPGTPAAGARR